jgi:flagellin
VSQLIDEVDRIASHAQFNGMNMLTGRFADADSLGGVKTGSMWFHIGANMDQREKVFIGTMTAMGLGIRQIGTGNILSISTADKANSSIGELDKALKKVNKQRADLGAYQNRLEYATRGLAVSWENLQAAESIIRDSNMASEMVEFTRFQILTQSSTSMLAQANAKTQTILQLLNA